MTQTLEMRPLGELVELLMGQAPSSKECNFDGSGTPFVKVGEFGESRPVIREWTTNPLRMARRTDVLLCVVGATCGKVNLGEDCAIGRSVAAIRPKPTKLDQYYLHYFMMTLVERLRSGSVGAAQTVISKEMIETVQIPFMPLPEQKRIVGILDEAFEGIAAAKANTEKNLKNARALFENQLQSVFVARGTGWGEKPLGSVATFRNGINFTKDSKGERIKIVGVRNFQKNFAAPLDDLDTVTIDGKLSELDSLKKDDILAVRSNGNIELIGRCLLVGEVVDKISHSGFTIRIRISPGEVLPSYLCHFMKSASTRKRLTEGGTGTNIKSLNQGMLSALVIPFPPVSTQKLIVEKLESLSDETQRLESIYLQKLAALEELRKSLLYQAFTGEL